MVLIDRLQRPALILRNRAAAFRAVIAMQLVQQIPAVAARFLDFDLHAQSAVRAGIRAGLHRLHRVAARAAHFDCDARRHRLAGRAPFDELEQREDRRDDRAAGHENSEDADESREPLFLPLEPDGEDPDPGEQARAPARAGARETIDVLIQTQQIQQPEVGDPQRDERRGEADLEQDFSPVEAEEVP